MINPHVSLLFSPLKKKAISTAHEQSKCVSAFFLAKKTFPLHMTNPRVSSQYKTNNFHCTWSIHVFLFSFSSFQAKQISTAHDKPTCLSAFFRACPVRHVASGGDVPIAKMLCTLQQVVSLCSPSRSDMSLLPIAKMLCNLQQVVTVCHTCFACCKTFSWSHSHALTCIGQGHLAGQKPGQIFCAESASCFHDAPSFPFLHEASS